MNKEKILKNMRSYDEWLVERLKKDPELAQEYLEASLRAYEEDSDTTAFLLALKSVAKAQGSISQLARDTGISREHLSDVLSGKHNPRLDNLLGILSGLGYRIRLERQEQEAIHESAVAAPNT